MPAVKESKPEILGSPFVARNGTFPIAFPAEEKDRIPMSASKIAFALALLFGAAQIAAADDAVATPSTATGLPPGQNPPKAPNPTIVPGKWDIKYKWAGNTTQVWNYPIDAPFVEVDPWKEDGSDTAVGGPLWAPPLHYTGNEIATSRTFDTAGTVTVTCTWVANTSSYANPPPNPQPVTAPTVLWLREASYAYASQAGSGPSALVDDGVGDPSRPWLNSIISGGYIDGTYDLITHLTRHQVFHNQVIFSRLLHASSPTAIPNFNGNSVELQYQAAEDNRSAMITCQDIESPANYYKLSSRGSNNVLRETNSRYSDGSMIVDTVVGSHSPLFQPEDNTSWIFNQSLQLIASGFDLTSTHFFGNSLVNTNITWSGSGCELFSTSYIPNLTVDASTSGTDDAIRSGPVEISAKVVVEDLRQGMEATAENNYTIRIHSPLENAQEIKSKQMFDYDAIFPDSEWVAAGNGVATVALIDDQPVPSFIQDNGATIGMWISGVAGSGGYALLLLPAAPEAALGPIVADMVCNAVGIALISVGTPPPPHQGTRSADFAAFSQAVAEEMQIINHTATDANMVCKYEHRIISGGPTAAIAADPDLLWKYWLTLNNPRAMCHSGVRMNLCTVGGDQYDINGYVGYKEDTILTKGVGFYVWEFDLSGKLGR